MSATNSTNRAELLKICSILRPALATQDYIPALKHIKFDGEFATTYNDVTAIVVQAKLPIKRCVPGDLLIRALSSFGGETLALVYDDKNSSLLASSGRSKLKLPTLPTADFPFEYAGSGTYPEIDLTEEMLKGIERCLLSVGSDPTHPAQMGITLESSGGKATLYSTDNFTISRFETDTKISLPGDTPIIMPTFFCEQILALHKNYPLSPVLLVMMGGALVADFLDNGNTIASVFTKTLIDLEPLDYKTIVGKHLGRGNESEPIPDQFDAAFNRALLVLGNELDKHSTVVISGGVLELFSSSSLGEANDEMPFAAGFVANFLIDPTLVVRASKSCTRVIFGRKAMVLTDDKGQFVHLIAHCAS